MKNSNGCAAVRLSQYASGLLARIRSQRRNSKRKTLQRRLRTEWLEHRCLMAGDTVQHNFFNAEDVNDDGQCSPVDALLIINELGSRQSNGARTTFSDVNNDGQRTPVDALMVINRLSRRGNGSPATNQPANPAGGGITIPTSTAGVRTYDGTGNNVNNTELGSVGEQLRRVAPAEYEDGVSSPAGATRANPREISNALATQTTDKASDRQLSAFVYVWGQFIDHDISLTISPTTGKETLNISIPVGDPFFDADGSGDAVLKFTRSSYDSATGDSVANPRQQVNEISAWIDGSMVYGSSQLTADSLRTFVGGRMKTSEGNLLPLSASGMFSAGDIRANENIELTSLHTLFVREHNYWADKIASANTALTDEQLFQQARAIVIAEIQSITYNEWLPALLGRNALSPYRGYDATVNPSVANEFSTAAFRLGHSLLQNDVEFMDNSGSPVREGVELSEAFFNPGLVLQEGIEGLLKYAASAQSAEIDTQIVDGVRNFLLTGPGGINLDLAALNIQRGRDHGLADYNATRVAYGLAPVDSFDDITSDVALQETLAEVYGSVEDVDLWIGGLAEDHLQGSSVGELVRTIVADQFQRLRDGDRFWYENIFSGRQLSQLRSTRLSDLIMRNTEITNLQKDVFYFRAAVSGTVMMTAASDVTGRGPTRNVSSGAGGVTVELLDDTGTVIDSTVTDLRGQYKFSSMAETGTYSVRVVPSAGTAIASTSTESIEVAISRGDTRLHRLDFRLVKVA